MNAIVEQEPVVDTWSIPRRCSRRSPPSAPHFQARPRVLALIHAIHQPRRPVTTRIVYINTPTPFFLDGGAVNFRLIAEQWDRIGQFYAAFPRRTRHRVGRPAEAVAAGETPAAAAGRRGPGATPPRFVALNS